MTETSETENRFSLSEQISCVQREIAIRQKVYPIWVRGGRMAKESAEREIACMRSVLATLEKAYALAFQTGAEL